MIERRAADNQVIYIPRGVTVNVVLLFDDRGRAGPDSLIAAPFGPGAGKAEVVADGSKLRIHVLSCLSNAKEGTILSDHAGRPSRA